MESHVFLLFRWMDESFGLSLQLSSVYNWEFNEDRCAMLLKVKGSEDYGIRLRMTGCDFTNLVNEGMGHILISRKTENGHSFAHLGMSGWQFRNAEHSACLWDLKYW